MHQLTGTLSDRRSGVIEIASADTASPATLDSLTVLAQELLAKVAALRQAQLIAEQRAREAQLAGSLRPPLSSSVPNAQPFDFYDEVRDFEKQLIRDALLRCNGCQRNAAELLGLKYTTLNHKVKSYGLRITDLLNQSPELKLAQNNHDGQE